MKIAVNAANSTFGLSFNGIKYYAELRKIPLDKLLKKLGEKKSFE